MTQLLGNPCMNTASLVPVSSGVWGGTKLATAAAMIHGLLEDYSPP